MSYKAKRTIVSMITSISLMIAYIIYTAGKIQSGAIDPENLRFWAITMLIFIGIGVVALIIILIVFHILLAIAMAVKEQVQTGNCDDKAIEQSLELDMVEDEMDKLIELKSNRIGFTFAGLGFVASLASLILNYSPAVMLNILFGSFYLGSLAEAITQLYYYRAGIKNN